MQLQAAAVTDIVADDRQPVGGLGAASGQVDRTAVVQGGVLVAVESSDQAGAAAQATAGVNVQVAAARAAVAQHQAVVEDHCRVIGQRHGLPVHVASSASRAAVLEHQAVVAQPAVERGRAGERGLGEVLDQCAVAAGAHEDGAMDDAGVAPVEKVIATAGMDFAIDRAIAHQYLVVAARGDDVGGLGHAADGAAGDHDHVIGPGADQVAEDGATLQLEAVVVIDQVDLADRAAAPPLMLKRLLPLPRSRLPSRVPLAIVALSLPLPNTTLPVMVPVPG